MYSMNESLSHLPTLWIISVATPERNIAMAPPDLMGCNPTSFFVNPNVSFPIKSTIPLFFALAYVESIYLTCPLSVYAHTLVSSFDYSIVVSILVIVYAHAFTGQSVLSFFLNI